MEPFDDHDSPGKYPENQNTMRRLPSSERPTVGLDSQNRVIPYKPLHKSFVVLPLFISYVVLSFLFLTINPLYANIRANSCSVFANKSVIVNGSQILAPLVRDVVHEYSQQCLGVNVSVNPNSATFPQGSLNGLKQVEKGSIDIGTSDVFADPNQNPDLQDYQVAVVVFALVVNDNMDITNLTINQIKKIYSGEIDNWSKVGSKKNRDIVLVSAPPTSGIRWTFETHVLGGQETLSDPQSLLNNTSEKIIQSLRDNPGAISYVPLYYAKKYGLKILSIEGKNPSYSDFASVKNGTYTFWNIEHMYTRGAPGSPVKEFIEHMFSTAALRVINQDGYLSPAEFPRSVLERHILQE